MNRIKTYLLFVCLFMNGVWQVHAQSNVVTSGGTATGSGGNASYSVGQIDYMSLKGNNGSVNQGVQHPHEFWVIKEEQPNGNEFKISATAYPNPTSGYLYLRIDSGAIEDLSYKIYDLSGRLIMYQKIDSKETTITLKDLSDTFYFLKVYKTIFEVQSFKIIKAN